MKLNFAPQELLALYNLLHQRLGDSDLHAASDLQLNQVYNRIKACIVSALSDRKHDHPVEQWLVQQKDKVSNLEVLLEDVKEELPKVVARGMGVVGLGPDFGLPEYPRGVRGGRRGRHRPHKG